MSALLQALALTFLLYFWSHFDLLCLLIWPFPWDLLTTLSGDHGRCLVTKLCLMLCDPVDSSPPGSSNHGILQARMLEWVALCFSRGSSQPKDRTCISWAGRWFLYLWATWQAHLVISKCLFCTSGLEDGLSAVLFPVALHTAVQHSLMGASASSGLRLFSCGVKLFCEVFPASLTWAPTWMTNLSVLSTSWPERSRPPRPFFIPHQTSLTLLP